MMGSNTILEKLNALDPHWGLTAVALLAGAILFKLSNFLTPVSPYGKGETPDSIPEWIPGVTNMYRYIFHNMDFINSAVSTLKHRTIMKFRLGPKPVYLITGAKNVQSVLRSSGSLSADELFYMALRNLDSVAESDIDKFKADRTGRSQIPAVPVPVGHDRLWYENHKIFAEYLTRPESVRAISNKYVELLERKLELERTSEWRSVRLYEWLKTEMVECAIISLSGSSILDMNPGFIDAMWQLDASVFPLIMGVPKWLHRKPYKARDAYLDMGEKYELWAHEKFDWDGPDVDKLWEPIFGSKFSRKHSSFLKDRDFKPRSRSGMHLGTIWALNANTVPITSWCLIELLKDPALLAEVRAEAESAFKLDSDSAKRTVDLKKLVELPLLQSIYAEALRMHVSINITREVRADMPLNGYILKQGYLVQAPSMIAHFDEQVWGAKKHPASEFWAERHITYVDHIDESGNTIQVRQFSLASKGGSLMAYGGGVSICPGRHFAKQEIIATVAMLVVNLDLELEGYVMMDGSKSDRMPMDDKWYCGTAAMPPDRDLKIRWRVR